MKFWFTFLVGSLLSFPCCAMDDEVSFQGGGSFSSGQSGTLALFAEGTQDYGYWGDSLWTIGSVATIGYLSSRSAFGYDKSLWLLGGGVRLQHDASPWWVEVQAVIPSDRTRSVDGALEFMPALGIQGDRWGVLVRHLGLTGPGETMLLISRNF